MLDDAALNPPTGFTAGANLAGFHQPPFVIANPVAASVRAIDSAIDELLAGGRLSSAIRLERMFD